MKTPSAAPPSSPENQGSRGLRDPRKPKLAAPKSSGAADAGSRNEPFDRVIGFFSSLRLTVVLLGLGMVLIFAGTLAQVNLGLYKAQNEFFRSFLIYWGPKGASWKLPVFPGGYLVGTLLLINLVTAHYQRFTFSRKKAGIWLTHVGIILLIVGQLLTDMLSRESSMHLREGEAKNYSEAQQEAELVLIDVTDRDTDKVVAIPQSLLKPGKEIAHRELPFKIRVKEFYPNAHVTNRKADAAGPIPATQGIGPRAEVRELPRVTEMDKRDVPASVVEIVTPAGSLGTWLASEFIEAPQTFAVNNHTYEVSLRPRRFYVPYSLQLLKFQHDLYAGTDTPKNFSSRVVLDRPDTREHREVLIYMNTPLRYAGKTYYQASYDEDDHGTILQVVRNPGWLTPYLSCVLVAAGLIVQFMSHLLGFAAKRRVD